jgi:hypothetical protein
MNRAPKPSPNPLIATLADDLAPVAPLKRRNGWLVALVAAAATVLGVSFYEGLWQAALAGNAAPIFFVTNGLLLLLGLAAAAAVLSLASPAVGNRQDAPKWATAMLAILPLTAVVTTLAGGRAVETLFDPHSLYCLTAGMAASVLTFAALTWWLRRGAPVSTGAAGLWAGIAAGAIGSFAYGLSCPIDSVDHLGVWHIAPVALCGVLGRIVLPRLFRW